MQRGRETAEKLDEEMRLRKLEDSTQIGVARGWLTESERDRVKRASGS